MRLAFHFDTFDADISSGTDHALFQWLELCTAFGVDHVYIIATTPCLGIRWPATEPGGTVVHSLDDVPRPNKHVMVDTKRNDGSDEVPYRDFKFKRNHTLVFGGNDGLPRTDVYIDTGTTALYPREAAAIVLEEAAWQLA